MSVTNPESARRYRPPASRRTAAPPPLHVLLVSDDPRWILPVREAVAAIGGVVETVTTRAAIARIAGIGTTVSHILADHRDDDGLLGTLSALVTDTAGAEIALLFLGTPAIAHSSSRVIRDADRQSVIASLKIRYFPVSRAEPVMTSGELLGVIAGGLIETRYQPIVRLADRTVSAVEVLARLTHPVHGSLTPDWFVRRFEDSGLSFTLTDLVSTRAFSERTGPELQGPALPMALNYPLAVLTHPGAALILDEKRAAAGLTTEQVAIELTESRPVEDFAALTRSLEHLRALGYRISIDDAGPGVGNLDRLLTLPFTGLKLDKAVVRAIGTRDPMAAYAPRITDLALAKGLTVVAEGVETWEIWGKVRTLGVHEAQGYFIARPLPAKAVPVWLEAWTDRASA